MRGVAPFLAFNLLLVAQVMGVAVASVSSPARRGVGFVNPSSTTCLGSILEPSSSRERSPSRKARRIRTLQGRSLLLGLGPFPDSTSTSAALPIHAHIPTVLRATTSALLTYIGIVAYLDRPRGTLSVSHSQVRVQASSVPGAGLGLFAAGNLARGTVLGMYPGVVVPLAQHTRKLQEFPACEGYIWRFSDNQMVIDPTNPRGELDETVVGGNPSQPGSVFLFGSILPKLHSRIGAPTTLCRINEPPRGKDVNVVTTEDLSTRTVTFELERDVYDGEELFIDYGLSYDRSRYGGESIESTESPSLSP